MSRIRKAIVAAIGVTVTGVISMLSDFVITPQEVVSVIGGIILSTWATWLIPNRLELPRHRFDEG